MASAEFLEQALSTNVDENAVNAIVGSLENQLVTSVASASSQNNYVNVIPSQNCNITPNAGSIISGQKYMTDQINCSGIVNSVQPNIASSSVSFNSVQASTQPTFTSLSLSGSPLTNESLKVIYTQAQHLGNLGSGVALPVQSLASACIGQTSQSQILHAVSGGNVLPQQSNKTIAMQNPLVIKQGANTGQVGMQTGMVTVPMTVNSSMPASIPNVMTLNKPGGQNVVVTTQNLGSAQPAIIPNVQILNMRPGAPTVAAQKSVATVSPRVVIGTPQVVGTRATAPITLQTLQSLQPGQQGHLLLKTENGQYQLLRVGPAPAANTLTAPQAQTIRLSTVPAHPGVATVSTSVAAPGPIPGQMPAPPIAAPVVASAPSVAVATPTPQQPSSTTHIATLGRGASLEQWAGWLEACVVAALAPHERRPDYTARARRLLLDWSFYSSLVIRELTLRSAASFGSFHLIRLLYDEYVSYLIERRVAAHHNTPPIAVMQRAFEQEEEDVPEEQPRAEPEDDEQDWEWDDDEEEDDEPTDIKKQKMAAE